jgi:NADH-quinone oxidoreductase subunit N
MTSIIILSIAGLFSMMAGIFSVNKKIVLGVLIFALVASFAFLISEWGTNISFFNDMLLFDDYALGFSLALVFLTLLILLVSHYHFEDVKTYATEEYALLVFSLVGMIVIVSYNHLVTIFVGIEIMSIPLYILAGSYKNRLSSNESALKYFLMGSFATGLLLMGITLVYGETSSFHLTKIFEYTENYDELVGNPLLILGLVLMIAGLGFKVSAAPFHFWTPDVYQGAPTIITSFMSTVVKFAGFVAFFRLMYNSMLPLQVEWIGLISIMAVLTITIGGVTAVFQTSFKRLLAYSSISHAGYMLLIFLVSAESSWNTLLFYGVSYSLASIVCFAIITFVEKQTQSDGFESFEGLSKTYPFLALSMTVASLSLAGIPLTAGFFGKFYVLSSTIESGFLWVAVIAIFNAIIGVYYYFKIIIAMYFKERKTPLVVVPVNLLFIIALFVCTIITIQLGLFPDLLYYLF